MVEKQKHGKRLSATGGGKGRWAPQDLVYPAVRQRQRCRIQDFIFLFFAAKAPYLLFQIGRSQSDEIQSLPFYSGQEVE